MKSENFESGGLELCDWQYTIKHTFPQDFKCGEPVFLKSNPEHPMIVDSINADSVTTKWYNRSGSTQFAELPPQCLLQYRYAGYMTYRGKFDVQLN